MSQVPDQVMESLAYWAPPTVEICGGGYSAKALAGGDLVKVTLSPPNKPSSHISGYMAHALEIGTILDRAKACLAGVEFDAFVCRGVSGLLVAPVLAYALGKKIGVVRKPDPSSHSCRKYEGHPLFGLRWVFCDDLVSSGNTLARTKEKVFSEFPDAELIAVLSYSDPMKYDSKVGFDPNEGRWS